MKVAAMMLLTLRGTPFIYYGEEIGMTDVAIPGARVVDVDGRDPERTPMQWDASPNAGFTTGTPWLPLSPDFPRVNVAAQRDDPASLFSLYRRLLKLRRGSDALRSGTYRSLRAPRGVYVYERAAERERLLVALNFTSSTRRVLLPVARAELVLSTDIGRESLSAHALMLGADEGVIVRL
jgi:alpha-glucosidase